MKPTKPGWWRLWVAGWEAVYVFAESRRELKFWRASDDQKWPVIEFADWQWGSEIEMPSAPPEDAKEVKER